MEIQILRNKIDSLDREIIKLLSKRFEIVEKVAEEKKKTNIEAHQPQRWAEVLSARKNMATENNLNIDLVCEIWETIHKYAISNEEMIIKK